MLTFLLLLIAAAVLGAVVALAALLFAARRLVGRTPTAAPPHEPIDPFVAARIDQMAVEFATRKGCTEAAPLVADKLRLLYKLAQRRGES